MYVVAPSLAVIYPDLNPPLCRNSFVVADIDNKLSCSICLDEFKLGERVLELPCEPSKHYFHIKNENCEGIIPWLSHNNTCPMCRYEFPTPPMPPGEEIVESQEEIVIHTITEERAVIFENLTTDCAFCFNEISFSDSKAEDDDEWVRLCSSCQ